MKNATVIIMALSLSGCVTARIGDAAYTEWFKDISIRATDPKTGRTVEITSGVNTQLAHEATQQLQAAAQITGDVTGHPISTAGK